MSSWRKVSLCVFATRSHNNAYILLQDRTTIKKHKDIPLRNLAGGVTFNGEEYSLFGGGVEGGETPGVAMQRELREETEGIEKLCLTYIGRYDYEDEHTSREAHVYSSPMPRLEYSASKHDSEDIFQFRVIEGSAWAVFNYEKVGSLYLPPGQHEILQSDKVRKVIMESDQFA